MHQNVLTTVEFIYIETFFLMSDTGTEIPMVWETMGKDENLRMVKLADSSQEYKDVLAEFTKTLGKTPNVIEVRTFYIYPVVYRNQPFHF